MRWEAGGRERRRRAVVGEYPRPILSLNRGNHLPWIRRHRQGHYRPHVEDDFRKENCLTLVFRDLKRRTIGKIQMTSCEDTYTSLGSCHNEERHTIKLCAFITKQ